MASITFPKLSERVFAVRAAWRRQMPLRVRVEAVRRAAKESDNAIPVQVTGASNRVESSPQPSSIGGPPVRQVSYSDGDSRVA
jgi:hypothetical protein